MYQRRGGEKSSGTCVIIAKPTAGKIPTKPSRCQHYIREGKKRSRTRHVKRALDSFAASGAATICYSLNGCAKIGCRCANTRVYPLFPLGGPPTLAVANEQIRRPQRESWIGAAACLSQDQKRPPSLIQTYHFGVPAPLPKNM